jgi:hypothetical protein
VNFEAIAELARRLKAEQVQKYGHSADESDADLRAFAVCVRSSRHIALIHAGPGPRAPRLVCFWGAALMRCDEVYLVTDYRSKTEQVEDLDNFVEPELGEFQRLWEEGKREGLSEGVMVVRMPFLGPVTSLSYPYVRTGTKLTWMPQTNQEPDHIEGAVPNFAKMGWERRQEMWPKMAHILDEGAAALGLPPDKQDWHTDRAIARYVSQQEGVGLVDWLEGGESFAKGQEVPA